MGTLQGEWNHIQWQLDPYKWYLHSNTWSRHGRHQNGDHFKLLPKRYEKQYLLRVMRYLSNEGMLGFLIFMVICFTLYMHTFMLDATRNVYLPSETKTEYRQKEESVMLAIVMHSPSTSLETTFRSLNASQHGADVFVFHNFVGDDVCENVTRWYPAAKFVSDKGQLSPNSIYQSVMNRFIFSKYDVLVSINSYTSLCAKWWNILMEGLDKSKGVFSLYGMPRDTEEMERCEELLCHQSWIGWTGSVWRRNLATRMFSETTKENGLYQYKMENWCKLKNIPIHAMKYSAIDIFDKERRLRGQLTGPQPYQYESEPTMNKNTNKENNEKQSTVDHQTSLCIAAVARVRIYRGDENKMTAFEVEQWIRYMQFAGVSVVYLYDAFERDDEKLYAWVKDVFDKDEVVYHSWYFNGTYDILDSIRSAYRHATRKYKYTCQWHIHADVNEYPFLANDTGKDFLKRLVLKIRSLKKKINEISFPIFQMEGKEARDPLLIGRLQNRYLTRISGGARPLFLAGSVRKTHIFHNKLYNGETLYLDPNLAKIIRYSPKNENKTTVENVIPDSSMFPLYKNLKNTNFISNKLPLYVINQFWNS